jgi:hypothetical protein
MPISPFAADSLQRMQRGGNMDNLSILTEKTLALPPNRIAEIEDFVEFIAVREHARATSHASAGMSAPAFAAVWDNPDDAAYDAL